MSGLGPKIIQSIKEAMAGDLARVTIEGVTWVRKDELDNLRAENARLENIISLHEQMGEPTYLKWKKEAISLRAEVAELRSLLRSVASDPGAGILNYELLLKIAKLTPSAEKEPESCP